MVYARVELDDYTNKVLNVIKAKYELRDKSAAINKMANMFGDEVVEQEAGAEYLKEFDRIYEEHIKKYGNRKMSIKDLNALCEM